MVYVLYRPAEGYSIRVYNVSDGWRVIISLSDVGYWISDRIR
jgi:hypothetical protein